MELYEEIILKVVKEGQIKNLDEIIHSKCYNSLEKIKQIVSENTLTDTDCFLKIEEIICTLESIGSNGGSRHDY